VRHDDLGHQCRDDRIYNLSGRGDLCVSGVVHLRTIHGRGRFMSRPKSHMMSKQEMFNVSAKHIIAQGKRSYVAGHGCLYRSPDGCMCGFGPFIPDDKYTFALEGKSAKGVIQTLGLDLDPDLADCLQKCHDGTRDDIFISDYKRRMRLLARNYGLDASVLEDAL
jgi:hypothetical protein